MKKIIIIAIGIIGFNSCGTQNCGMKGKWRFSSIDIEYNEQVEVCSINDYTNE
tara:strand:- start:147 stop:305 length:159 start_codon:yes stop_codon:yes gene_type:complete